MTGESPTLPTILFLIPPVDVAHATLPAWSTATAPTVSWVLNGTESNISLFINSNSVKVTLEQKYYCLEMCTGERGSFHNAYEL